MREKEKKPFSFAYAAILAVLVGLAGFFAGRFFPVSESSESSASRQPYITVTVDEDAGVRNIAGREDVVINDLTDVTLHINGTARPLEEALENEEITPAQIWAYARMDAANEVCQEQFSSQNGLARFTYEYPEYELQVVYDVYETPDGKQHLIQHLAICEPGSQISLLHFDESSEYNYRLDREDWGLTLEVAEVSATGITLDYTQSGGQQFGDLEVSAYFLYNSDLQGLTPISESASVEDLDHPAIGQNTSGTLRLEWENFYGSLSSGEYAIQVEIQDQYDPDPLHPFTRNYYDQQGYYLRFTLP